MTGVLKLPFRVGRHAIGWLLVALRFIGWLVVRFVTRGLWPALRRGVPATLRGFRGIARWVWPKLVVGFALIGLGFAKAGNAVKRTVERDDA